MSVDGVYPRPRGVTRKDADEYALDDGLSPPTRGNLMLYDERVVNAGSIPAHAG